jgi:type IV pilus assembly protein PilN
MADFNFFEPYIDKPTRGRSAGVLWLVLFVLVFGAMGFLQYSYLTSKSALEDDMTNIRAYTESSAVIGQLNVVNEKKMLRDAMGTVASEVNVFDWLMYVKSRLHVGLFNDILSQVPEYVFITSMNMTPTQVVIAGYSDSYDSVALFQHQLRSINRFSNVFVPNISENQGNYVFTMTSTFATEVPNANE